MKIYQKIREIIKNSKKKKIKCEGIPKTTIKYQKTRGNTEKTLEYTKYMKMREYKKKK